MSVAVNLLPDVRLARLRRQHLRRLVTSLSVLIWLIVGGVVVMLLLAIGAQRLQLASLNGQINDRTNQINAIPKLTEALTAQSALQALPGLYAQRTSFSKLIPILAAAVPTDVSLGSITTDAANGITITGTAASAVSVDHFYESLKAAGSSATGTKYFTNLGLTGVSKDQSGRASYTITATLATEAINAAN